MKKRPLLDKLWYSNHVFSWFLWPFSLIYKGIAAARRFCLVRFYQQQFSVPIIVIGNLTVGGVGKTPLVIALAQQFQAKGLKVGVVSRGYGAAVRQFPHEVSFKDEANWVGDEPLLIAKKTGCPVVIAPKRVQAVEYLLAKHNPQIILSDDGLQHYAMGRAIEITVIDGLRGLGNGMCLPAGPLREGASRLQKSDFIVVNSGEYLGAYNMEVQPGQLRRVSTDELVGRQALQYPVAAVAGIGNPERFFTTLNNMGIAHRPYSFADHHSFQSKDFQSLEKTVVMTEKDAVKCRLFAPDTWYVLPIEAKLSDAFWKALWSHEHLQHLQGHI